VTGGKAARETVRNRATAQLETRVTSVKGDVPLHAAVKVRLHVDVNDHVKDSVIGGRRDDARR
jgi:hypothetical protein